jgi:NAD(P)H-dependent FMN reductase
MSSKIYVIVGSIRANRIGRQIAEWVLSSIADLDTVEGELVDLNDWHLPLSDEPNIPARGIYLHEHTQAWSRKIAAAAGYIFVTPQYNWGYPASLKNALDHLYKEWNGKPAVIVSYGHHGGVRCAAQLRQVLDRLQIEATATAPAITFDNEMLTETGALRDPAGQFARYVPIIREAVAELATALSEGQPA